jgi:hypothetical protein
MMSLDMNIRDDKRASMRSKRAWDSSGNPLRGFAIASIPAPAFAQDNVVATATLP